MKHSELFETPIEYHPFLYQGLLHYKFWETGWTVFPPARYSFIGYAAASQDMYEIVLYGIGVMVFCYLFGYAWHRFNFAEVVNAINNKFNPFVREMLKK